MGASTFESQVNAMSARQEDDAIQASLGKPGAGIPWIEKIAGRLILSKQARNRSRERILEDFCSGAGESLALLQGIDDGLLRRRVLVPRQPGMEDSSRYWSAFMIIQHLAIVDRQVLGLVRLLSTGRGTDRQVSTAAVKPQPGAGPEVLAEFEAVIREWRENLPDEAKLAASAKHSHPWFGPMNAQRWFCMAAWHHRLHKAQLRAVLKGAGKS